MSGQAGVECHPPESNTADELALIEAMRRPNFSEKGLLRVHRSLPPTHPTVGRLLLPGSKDFTRRPKVSLRSPKHHGHRPLEERHPDAPGHLAIGVRQRRCPYRLAMQLKPAGVEDDEHEVAGLRGRPGRL